MSKHLDMTNITDLFRIIMIQLEFECLKVVVMEMLHFYQINNLLDTQFPEIDRFKLLHDRRLNFILRENAYFAVQHSESNSFLK